MGGRRWEEADITQNRETAAIEATRLTEEADDRDEATVTHDQAPAPTVTVTTTAMMTDVLITQEGRSEANDRVDIPDKVEKAIDRGRI